MSAAMKTKLSRRNFLQSSTLAAACAATGTVSALTAAAPALAESVPASGKPSPIKLGLASYTFRNFTRAQVIGFMKQLNLADLNCKDAKDHLPMDPADEAKAVADYTAAGIKLHAAGTISFPKDDDDDIRAKFEYVKRAGINVIVAGDPAPTTLPRIGQGTRSDQLAQRRALLQFLHQDRQLLVRRRVLHHPGQGFQVAER